MSELITALGLVLVIEGLLYALAPRAAKGFLLQVLETPPETLRLIGIGALAAGVVVVWLAKTFG